MSLATIWASIEADLETTEQDVLSLIANIKNEVAVVEADLASALKWVASMAPTIATDLQSTLSLVQSAGIAVPAPALLAANAAVAGLDAIADAQNSGQNSAQTLVNGYVAVKQAVQAQAATAIAVAQAPGAANATIAPSSLPNS